MSKPELVTIDHDEYGVYVLGSPYAKKTLLPHVHRLDRFFYLTAALDANYPLPATLDNADKALNWLHLSMCPHVDGPCYACIDKFTDAIELDYLSDLDELDQLIINELATLFDD